MIIIPNLLLLWVLNFLCSVNGTEAPHETVSACDDEEEDDTVVPVDDHPQVSSESTKELREAIVGQMQDKDRIATSSEIPEEKINILNDIKPSNIDQSPVSNIDKSAIASRESNIKSEKVESFIYSQPLKSSILERPNSEIGNFGKPVQKSTGLGSVPFSGQSADVPGQSFLNVKESTKRLGSTSLQDASELSRDKAMFLNKIDPASSVLPLNSLQSSKTENFGPSFGAANAFTGFSGKSFQTKDVPSTFTQIGRQVTAGAGKIESLPPMRSSQILSQDNFSLGKNSSEKHSHSERNYSNVPLAKPVSSEQNLFNQFTSVSILHSNVGMTWFKDLKIISIVDLSTRT